MKSSDGGSDDFTPPAEPPNAAAAVPNKEPELWLELNDRLTFNVPFDAILFGLKDEIDRVEFKF